MFGRKLCKLQWRKIGFNFLLLMYVSLVSFSLLNKTSRVKYYMLDDVANGGYKQANMCTLNPNELGKVEIEFSEPTIKSVEILHSSVSSGGKWQPNDCVAVQKVAIIIPHRNRQGHLLMLLKRLHTLLQKQKLEYHVIVVEQNGKAEFNRGRLLNIGVYEAMKIGQFDCFVFHDVDLIPEHDRNFYVCDDQLRHLASSIDEMRYHVMYNNYAGGVVAVNKNNVLAMNGYSNDYWGWGSEDDDFSARSMGVGLLLTRPPENIGRYKMVKHYKQWRSNNGYDYFLTWRSRWKADGLNNVEDKYKLLKKDFNQLYTNITVDIGQPILPEYQHLPRETTWWFLQFFFP